MSITKEEFDQEFPPGSQKRQEEIWRLERESAEAAVPVTEPTAPEVPETPVAPSGSGIPESVWRGNG